MLPKVSKSFKNKYLEKQLNQLNIKFEYYNVFGIYIKFKNIYNNSFLLSAAKLLLTQVKKKNISKQLIITINEKHYSI